MLGDGHNHLEVRENQTGLKGKSHNTYGLVIGRRVDGADSVSTCRDALRHVYAQYAINGRAIDYEELFRPRNARHDRGMNLEENELLGVGRLSLDQRCQTLDDTLDNNMTVPDYEPVSVKRLWGCEVGLQRVGKHPGL
jgi:hypothetical protein